MSAKRDTGSPVGVGVAACAACCAGPILGALAAIGIGTAAGYALFGAVAVIVGAIVIGVVLVRRRRATSCASAVPGSDPTPVALTETRPRT